MGLIATSNDSIVLRTTFKNSFTNCNRKDRTVRPKFDSKQKYVHFVSRLAGLTFNIISVNAGIYLKRTGGSISQMFVKQFDKKLIMILSSTYFQKKALLILMLCRLLGKLPHNNHLISTLSLVIILCN